MSTNVRSASEVSGTAALVSPKMACGVSSEPPAAIVVENDGRPICTVMSSPRRSVRNLQDPLHSTDPKNSASPTFTENHGSARSDARPLEPSSNTCPSVEVSRPSE